MIRAFIFTNHFYRMLFFSPHVMNSYLFRPIHLTALHNNGHRIEDTIIRVVEKERELDAEIDRLVDLKKEISGVIGQVADTDLQILLEYRYLCYKKWPEIADLMLYGISNIFKMHDKALRAVEEILKNSPKECTVFH